MTLTISDHEFATFYNIFLDDDIGMKIWLCIQEQPRHAWTIIVYLRHYFSSTIANDLGDATEKQIMNISA